MTEEKKAEIKSMPWMRMTVVRAPMGELGMEGYVQGEEYLYKKYIDNGKEVFIVTNHDIKRNEMGPDNVPFGDVSNLGRNTFGRYFKPLKETKMEENKNTETGRMQELLKSFNNKNEVIKEEKEITVDEGKILEESERLKELARIDEWASNNQFATGTAQFNPGFGQTVNTFLPNNNQNNFKYNPNYTYLQPSEALSLAIKRTIESGAPVKDMGFYEEVNWNLNNMGFDSKLPLDIKNAVAKLAKDNA